MPVIAVSAIPFETGSHSHSISTKAPTIMPATAPLYASASSSAMFEGNEGIWEVNIALDAIEGFTGEETFEQAYELLINFVTNMLGALEA